LPAEAIGEAVLALAEDHPSRPDALARLGGPGLRVDEHTAPDEAANTLGRLIVGVGPGERATVQCDWTLERGEQVRTVVQDERAVPDGGMVINAPFRWDDSLTPTRWTLLVTARWASEWGEVTMRHRHRSEVLVPGLTSWLAAVSAPDTSSDSADWQLFQADPFDPDFASLTDRYGVPLQHQGQPEGAWVVHARTRLAVTTDCVAAFAYYSSDDVELFLDGQPLAPASADAEPAWYYDLVQRPRRTEPIRLAAGSHELSLRCTKSAELPWYQWLLAVSAVDPDSGEVLLGITSDASAWAAPAATGRVGTERVGTD